MKGRNRYILDAQQHAVMVSDEELDQMTPEEMAEFQKKNCVFCKIASGEIPAKTVYSDEQSVAVLDINPAAKGHLLLLPKEHYAVMPQLPEPLVNHLAMVCKALTQTTLRAMQCNGTTIFIANGAAAGQRAPHFMVHIIPRKDGDTAFPAIPVKEFPKKREEKIRNALAAAFGKKQKPEDAEEGSSAEDAEVSNAQNIPETGGKKAKKTKGRAKGSAGIPKSKKKVKKEAENKGFDLDSVTDMLTK